MNFSLFFQSKTGILHNHRLFLCLTTKYISVQFYGSEGMTKSMISHFFLLKFEINILYILKYLKIHDIFSHAHISNKHAFIQYGCTKLQKKNRKQHDNQWRNKYKICKMWMRLCVSVSVDVDVLHEKHYISCRSLLILL